MILKVNKDICEIKQNEVWNVGDYNVHTVQVELSEEFDGLVNKVRFFVEDNSYDMLITDNVAEVPREATLTEGIIRIGVYGYDADTDILVQSTSPVNKYIASGTYTGEADNTEPLTPTDKQQMETAIQKNTNDIIDLQNNKQDKLISGVNIKTINNESILSGGNLTLVTEETDPIFTNSPAYSITDNDITYWNNKANISDIPDVSNFITKDVNNLTYYTKTTDMQTAINNAVGTERTARENADNNLQGQIDAITSSSDVKDIVGSYTELQNYDTSTLGNDDIVKVLQDSTHGNAMTYYRWIKSGSSGHWEYIGQEGPYYTKSEADTLLNDKQNVITSSNKILSDLVNDTNQTNKFVTTTDITNWNNKGTYSKPSGGIPASDLASAVQTSLGKADTAIQSSDLTNYVTNTDYATSSVGGVLKVSNGDYGMAVDEGVLKGTVRTYAQYNSMSSKGLVAKGTLENVITGKGLVSNTDYATDTVGGVIKTSSGNYATSLSNGQLTSLTKTYQEYTNARVQMFISKGTLENVITGKGLVSNTDYATSQKGGVIKCFNSDGLNINNGTLITSVKTYAQYNSAGNWMFIGKGTLENVITGKELDLKQLSTFDSTKTQVLKNINGTLTWVDE